MRKFKPVILIFLLAVLMYSLSYIPTLHWAHEGVTHSLCRGVSYFLLGFGLLILIRFFVSKKVK